MELKHSQMSSYTEYDQNTMANILEQWSQHSSGSFIPGLEADIIPCSLAIEDFSSSNLFIAWRKK